MSLDANMPPVVIAGMGFPATVCVSLALSALTIHLLLLNAIAQRAAGFVTVHEEGRFLRRYRDHYVSGATLVVAGRMPGAVPAPERTFISYWNNLVRARPSAVPYSKANF